MTRIRTRQQRCESNYNVCVCVVTRRKRADDSNLSLVNHTHHARPSYKKARTNELLTSTPNTTRGL